MAIIGERDPRRRRGRAKQPSARLPAPDGDELDRNMRPAVTLVSAWVSEVARRQQIDTALLATRTDLVAFLRGDPDARLATGWRHELLGDGIRRLVAGEAALTFDGEGGLRLVDVPDAGLSRGRQPGSLITCRSFDHSASNTSVTRCCGAP